MKIMKASLLLLVGLSVAGATGCGKTADSATAAPPQLSAADRAKRDEMNRKAQVGAMSDQINRSSLTPEQKQQMLQQVKAPARK